MNAMVAPETTEPGIPVSDQARTVSALLKEYTAKLSELNGELIGFSLGSGLVSARVIRLAAWLLDQAELLRKPLSNVISRGSAILEYSSPDAVAKLKEVAPLRVDSGLDPLTADELALRMREIEIHYHHMIRLCQELRQLLERANSMEAVKKLRMVAGLPGGQNGPLGNP